MHAVSPPDGLHLLLHAIAAAQRGILTSQDQRQLSDGFVQVSALIEPGRGLSTIAVMNSQALFHLAFAVRDLAEARAFHAGLLGCPEGRSSSHWIDFNFFGHQLVAQLSPDGQLFAR